MIDTVSAEFELPHPVQVLGGGVLHWDVDGVETWRKEKFRELEGSFDAFTSLQTVFATEAERKYQIESAQMIGPVLPGTSAPFRRLKINGSPAKFLQGHNLFGSENVLALLPLWFRAAAECAGIFDPTSVEHHHAFEAWQSGDFKLHRIDIARMADVGGLREVADTLAALSHQSTYLNRGRSQKYGSTGCRWGSRATRTTVFKAYDKFTEIGLTKHELPEFIPERERLRQFAAGKVRFEVELHSKFLDAMGLRKGSAWHTDTPDVLFGEAMNKLSIVEQAPLTAEMMLRIPHRVRGTYALWETGRDVRMLFPNKQNYYKHRQLLLDFGIDIAQPRGVSYVPKVVSLRAVIQAVPASTPTWAHGTQLLAAA